MTERIRLTSHLIGGEAQIADLTAQRDALLAACKAALVIVGNIIADETEDKMMIDCVLQRLRAAIKKAEEK